MQVKFIQIADFHLDSKFLGLYDIDKIDLRKKELEETFKKIIQFTNTVKDEESLDFLAVAGDLFEQDCFSPQTIKSLIIYGFESLKPLPVFVVAGNHDMLQDDSPYSLYKWPDNVFIFPSDFKKVKIKDNVYLYGISVSPENFNKNMLKNLRIENPESLNMILMHGSETGNIDRDMFGDCMPFSSEDIMDSKADYIILGHYHNSRKVPLGGDIIKGYYSGTPESLSFKEIGERFILKAALNKNDLPQIEKISFQRRIYKEINIDCTGITSSEEVKNLLENNQDKNVAANIILKGDIDPDIRIDIDELSDYIKQEDLFFAANIKNKIRLSYTEDIVSSSALAGNYLKAVNEAKNNYPPELIDLVKKIGLDSIFTKDIRNWNEV